MPFHVRDGGSWHEVTSGNFHVRDGGSWHEVQEGWVRDAGAWKSFYINAVVTLSGFGFTSGPGGATFLYLEVRADGTTWRVTDAAAGNAQINASTDWIIPNDNSGKEAYEVRFTLSSGDAPTEGSTGVWQALSTTRVIGYDGVADKDGTILVEIRVGTETLASSSYSFDYNAA